MQLLGMILCLFAFASPQETAGTMPVRVQRQIAGPPGTTIVAARDGIVLEATTTQDGGTQELAVSAMGQVAVTPWTSGGILREVRTTRLDNEKGDAGAARWAARHQQAEQAMFRLWPPDPPSTGE